MTDRTCARCGHHGFLGGTIGNQHYCHTLMASPTCYEIESRWLLSSVEEAERARRYERYAMTPEPLHRVKETLNRLRAKRDDQEPA